MNLMNIIDVLFWLLLGILYIWGVQFQYHESVIGICALFIGISKTLNILNSR